MLHPAPDPVVYTLGYGARSVDEVLDLLRELCVNWLVDVRSRPYSRYKPEFGKEPLEGRIRQEGIGYVFLGDAIGGMPPASDWYEGGQLDADRYRESDGFQAGVQRLIDGVGQGLRLCLMCSEQDPRNCHRANLIGETLHERGVRVRHIDENDELLTQEELNRGDQLELGF